MIISFINQKGGVGKTTLCINSAFYMGEKFFSSAIYNGEKNTLLVDMDPQQTSFDFLSTKQEMYKEELPFDYIASTRFDKSWNEKYQYVFIDSGGFDSEETRDLLKKSDAVVIPVQPSPKDFRSTEVVINTIEDNAILGYKPKVFLVFNMVQKKVKKIIEWMIDTKKSFEDNNLHTMIFPKFFTHSADFSNTDLSYRTLFDSDNDKHRIGKSARIIRELTDIIAEKRLMSEIRGEL